MLAKLSIAWLVLLAYALLAFGAPTFPPQLVPSTDTKSDELESLDDGIIRNPDDAVRDETVQEKSPGYLDSYGNPTQYTTFLPPTNKPTHLNGDTLKTCCG